MNRKCKMQNNSDISFRLKLRKSEGTSKKGPLVAKHPLTSSPHHTNATTNNEAPAHLHSKDNQVRSPIAGSCPLPLLLQRPRFPSPECGRSSNAKKMPLDRLVVNASAPSKGIHRNRSPSPPNRKIMYKQNGGPVNRTRVSIIPASPPMKRRIVPANTPTSSPALNRRVVTPPASPRLRRPISPLRKNSGSTSHPIENKYPLKPVPAIPSTTTGKPRAPSPSIKPPSPSHSRPASPRGRGSSPGARPPPISEEALKARIVRALQARLYLLHQPGPNSFSVGGDSPNHKFKVIIGPQSCSCGHGPYCVHVLFVMLRVLKLSQSDPALINGSLKDFEVEQLLKCWSERRKKAVRARETRGIASLVKSVEDPKSNSAKDKLDKNGNGNSQSSSSAVSTDSNCSERESQCPICLFNMIEGESQVTCENGCHNTLHQHCMAVLAHHRQVQRLPLICPLCRAPWVANFKSGLSQKKNFEKVFDSGFEEQDFCYKEMSASFSGLHSNNEGQNPHYEIISRSHSGALNKLKSPRSHYPGFSQSATPSHLGYPYSVYDNLHKPVDSRSPDNYSGIIESPVFSCNVENRFSEKSKTSLKTFGVPSSQNKAVRSPTVTPKIFGSPSSCRKSFGSPNISQKCVRTPPTYRRNLQSPTQNSNLLSQNLNLSSQNPNLLSQNPIFPSKVPIISLHPATIRDEISYHSPHEAAEDPNEVILLPRTEPIPQDHVGSVSTWVCVFGRDLVAFLFSKDWAVRETGLKRLHHEVVNVLHWDHGVTSEFQEQIILCCANILAQVANDPVHKVYLACLRCLWALLSLLCPQTESEVSALQELLRPLVHTLLLKCVDGNRSTSKISIDTIFELCKDQDGDLALGTQAGVAYGTPTQFGASGSLGLGGIEYILSCIFEKRYETSWQWLLGRLCVLDKLLDKLPQEFELHVVKMDEHESGYKLENYDRLMTVIEFAFKALASKHTTVAKLARRIYIFGAKMAAAEPMVFHQVCDMLSNLDASLQMRLKRRLKSMHNSHERRASLAKLGRKFSFPQDNFGVPRLVRSVSHSPSRMLSILGVQGSHNPPPLTPFKPKSPCRIDSPEKLLPTFSNNSPSTFSETPSPTFSEKSPPASPKRPNHLPLDSFSARFQEKQAKLRQYHKNRSKYELPLIVQQALMSPIEYNCKKNLPWKGGLSQSYGNDLDQSPQTPLGNCEPSSLFKDAVVPPITPPAPFTSPVVERGGFLPGHTSNNNINTSENNTDDNPAYCNFEAKKIFDTINCQSEGAHDCNYEDATPCHNKSENATNGDDTNAIVADSNDEHAKIALNEDKNCEFATKSKEIHIKARNSVETHKFATNPEEIHKDAPNYEKSPRSTIITNCAETHKIAIHCKETHKKPIHSEETYNIVTNSEETCNIATNSEETYNIATNSVETHKNATNCSENHEIVIKCQKISLLQSIPGLDLIPKYLSSSGYSNASLGSTPTYEEGRDWVRGPLLGTGAFSTCYQARDSCTGTIMAVKLISITRNSEEERDRVEMAVEDEILMLSQLEHANVVRMFGSVRSGQTFSIFSEWMAGGSVATMLDKFGPFSDGVIRGYTKQIFEGLSYLHDNMVLHRDLKGANLLIDSTGKVLRIGDFGTATKMLNNATITGEFQGQLLGTIAYMAPEVLRGDNYGRACDIWSVGCCIIEMGTGKPPWGADDVSNQYKLMFRIATSEDPPAIPENFSPQTQEITLRCLQIKSQNRPTAKQFLHFSIFNQQPP